MVLPRKDDVPPLESERPRSVTEARILTPTLIILLGSTPALAALETMRMMLPLNEEDRQKVAFVFIDTDDVPPPLVAFRQANSGFQEFKLRIAVPGGIDYAEHIDQGDLGKHTDEQFTFIESFVPQFFANGAGGIRNNGHVAACFNYTYIANSIEQALASITRIGNYQGARQPTEIQVNIVSFLGGGTGSGITPDIAVLVRQQLLKLPGMKQRINIFCMLPEQIPGVDAADVSWRKSNSTACLLEIVALSLAPGALGPNGSPPQGTYTKWMRESQSQLPNEPIANEVYLVGQSGMGAAGGTARLVGLDLYQRATDASGLGFLEHSKWVDRRTLGTRDDRNLPNIFGTSCPVDVTFMAHEMAPAFAKVSTAKLLPILAAFDAHKPFTPTDRQQAEWLQKWRATARPTAGRSTSASTASNIQPMKEFRQDDFEGAVGSRLNSLWNRLVKTEEQYQTQIEGAIHAKMAEEMQNIAATPRSSTQRQGLMALRFQHLQALEAEYDVAFTDLKEHPVRPVPRRPVDAESQLLNDPPHG